MSVVQGDFEKLKKYNLAEIFDPTPLPPLKPEAGPVASAEPAP
jgi:tRNA acetyltransferase TAN1